MNPLSQLDGLFKEHLERRFFTHVFAECGFLQEDAPTVRKAILPENRDLFDLSSLTKALVTTPLIYKELGSLGLGVDTKVGDWFSAAGKKAAFGQFAELGQISIRSLLRHESGLPYWQNFYVRCSSSSGDNEGPTRDLWASLSQGATESPNRGRSVYSDPGFIFLGKCLELIVGQSLDQQFEKFCRDDLSLDLSQHAVGYSTLLGSSLKNRAISTGFCRIRNRELLGEVHDENCWALGGVTGHAGLFGTGEAVAQFLKKLARTKIGKTLLSDNAAAVVRGPNEPLIGWRQGADPSSETFGAGLAMGHMGFTGVAFWVLPNATQVNVQKSDSYLGKYSILLTNRVLSGRTSPLTRPFRREAFSSLWRALSGPI